MRIAIVGASGVTGGFAFDAAEQRGLAPIVIGRDGPGLRQFAQRRGLTVDRVRIADACDPAALRQALDGVTHVISAVAPFARNGFAIAQAAAELGLGYTDSTGEAGFMLRMIDTLDTVASQSGATLCTGNGASAFVGDVATRWIAPSVDLEQGEATILYNIRDYRPTWGTLESYLTSILPDGGAAVRNGKVTLLPLAAFAGQAQGIRGIHGIMPDPIVISRYWPARRIDALMKGGAGTRPLVKAIAGLTTRPAIRTMILRLPLKKWTAYRQEDDNRSTVTAHVEVRRADGSSICRSVRLQAIYPSTGQIMVATLQAMARRNERPAGVRAASEMFADFDEVTELTDVRDVTGRHG